MNDQNVKNLSSILFYTGDYANDAATYTAGREYGEYVEGLGYLTKTSDGNTTWTNASNIVFEESTSYFTKLGDIYVIANSYAKANYNDYPIGDVKIKNNRYNVNYAYENALNNDFENAADYITQDLTTFLKSMNEQIYNKQKYYGDDVEISAIHIGQTKYTWYPIGHVAYTWLEDVEDGTAWNYEWKSTRVGEAAYMENYMNNTDTDYYIYSEEDQRYYHYEVDFESPNTYEYTVYRQVPHDYVIGDNYYSYVRKVYNPIETGIKSYVNVKLGEFKERYNNDATLYSYYMYDCTSDIPMTLDSKSIGTKQSTFEVKFDGIYNNWFTYNIILNASVETNDLILNIVSGEDNAIYNVKMEDGSNLTGDNRTLNNNDMYTFAAENDADKVMLLTPQHIKSLDLSMLKSKWNIDENEKCELNLTESKWNVALGTKLESIKFDDGNPSTTNNLTKISGLNELTSLKSINIENCGNLEITPAISALVNLEEYKAKGSSITNFRPATGVNLKNVTLPDTIKLIRLVETTCDEESFDYTPNANLTSLTLNNVTGIDTLKFIKRWFNALRTNIDNSVIYLNLKGIDWVVDVDFLKNLRRFDINQLEGNMFVIGSGEYGFLTRNEYRDIIKYYGINAFEKPQVSKTNKVFPNLILNFYNKEDFEYNITVNNDTLKAKVEAYNELEGLEKTVYYQGLSQKEQYELTEGNKYEGLVVEIENTRAGDSFLDIINNKKLHFVYDKLEGYAYYKLNTSIDTTGSVEYDSPVRGDILLFNGDTILIFNEDLGNYKGVKIGHINDETFRYYASNISMVETWLTVNSEFDLEFIPATEPVRPNTNINITSDYTTIWDNPESTGVTEINVTVSKSTPYNISIDETIFNIDETEDEDNDIYTLTVKEPIEENIVSEIKVWPAVESEEEAFLDYLENYIYNVIYINVKHDNTIEPDPEPDPNAEP